MFASKWNHPEAAIEGEGGSGEPCFSFDFSRKEESERRQCRSREDFSSREGGDRKEVRSPRAMANRRRQ